MSITFITCIVIMLGGKKHAKKTDEFYKEYKN